MRLHSIITSRHTNVNVTLLIPYRKALTTQSLRLRNHAASLRHLRAATELEIALPEGDQNKDDDKIASISEEITKLEQATQLLDSCQSMLAVSNSQGAFKVRTMMALQILVFLLPLYAGDGRDRRVVDLAISHIHRFIIFRYILRCCAAWLQNFLVHLSVGLSSTTQMDFVKNEAYTYAYTIILMSYIFEEKVSKTEIKKIID